MNYDTNTLIEEILYISLYDRNYNPIPIEFSEVIKKQVVDNINYISESISQKFSFIEYEKINISNLLFNSGLNLYTYNTNFSNIDSINININNVVKLIELSPLDFVITLAENQKGYSVSSNITYCAFDRNNKQLLIYASNLMQSLTVFGKKFLPTFQIENEIITPSTFIINNQRFLIEYIKLKVAKVLCENNNVSFSNDKNLRILELSKLLEQKKKFILNRPNYGYTSRPYRLLDTLKLE